MNQKKAGVVLSYLSLGLSNLISIIYTPIMLSLLGKNEYGLYSLAASLIGYRGLLNFGFSGSYMRFYSRYRAKKDTIGIARLNGMFLLIFTFIALITFLAGIVLVYYSDSILGTKLTNEELRIGKILLIILVLNMCLSLPSTVFYVYITAHERFVFQKVIGLIQVIVGPLTILPILMLGYGSIGIVTVTTLLTIGLNIANMYFCFKKLNIRFSFKNLDFSLLKEMSIFSSFIFINVLIDQINWSVDKYILARVKGTSSVAVYSIGAALNKYYMSFAVIMASVFIPQVNRMVAEKDDNTELLGLMIKTGRIQFIVLSLIASGFVIFGREFINLWVGNDYDNAYFIALILIITTTIPFIQSIGIEIQRAKNKHKFRSIAYLIIAIINITISIPLAKMYGGIGCAMGTGFSLIVGNGLIMNWYYHKKIGLNIKNFWKEIIKFFPALIFPGIVGFGIMFYLDINQLLPLIGAIIVYGLCYILSMWLLGLNTYEKSIAISFIDKIKSLIFGQINKEKK
jgi:O-antigen/teichoic acid export membrane protein